MVIFQTRVSLRAQSVRPGPEAIPNGMAPSGKVVSVGLEHTIPQCLALMNEHGFRHLPVIDQGEVIGVLSIRDLLKEIVEHHERLIRNMELEKMTILNQSGSTY